MLSAIILVSCGIAGIILLIVKWHKIEWEFDKVIFFLICGMLIVMGLMMWQQATMQIN